MQYIICKDNNKIPKLFTHTPKKRHLGQSFSQVFSLYLIRTSFVLRSYLVRILYEESTDKIKVKYNFIMEQIFQKKGNLEQLVVPGFEGVRRVASLAFNFDARQVGRVADFALDL
jgi:hypothetical protein